MTSSTSTSTSQFPDPIKMLQAVIEDVENGRWRQYSLFESKAEDVIQFSGKGTSPLYPTCGCVLGLMFINSGIAATLIECLKSDPDNYINTNNLVTKEQRDYLRPILLDYGIVNNIQPHWVTDVEFLRYANDDMPNEHPGYGFGDPAYWATQNNDDQVTTEAHIIENLQRLIDYYMLNQAHE